MRKRLSERIPSRPNPSILARQTTTNPGQLTEFLVMPSSLMQRSPVHRAEIRLRAKPQPLYPVKPVAATVILTNSGSAP
jgi:hypothetical protein